MFSLLLLAACAKKPAPQAGPPHGLDYYPVQKGHFVVYECDSTVYSDLPSDTINYRFLLKERVGEEFVDDAGNETFRFERFVKPYSASKPYDSIVWRLKEVWAINASEERIETVEGNRRFVKLVFPVEENRWWNGNAFNSLGEQTYSYSYVDQQEALVSGAENVLKVKQNEFKTLISEEYAYEKYAQGIGLVYREKAALFSNNILPNIPVQKRIEKGYVYSQTMVTYGVE